MTGIGNFRLWTTKSFFCKPGVSSVSLLYTLIVMFTIRIYNFKYLQWFSIFANVSSFPSDLNRKFNVKDWADLKYCVEKISVLLDNNRQDPPTFTNTRGTTGQKNIKKRYNCAFFPPTMNELCRTKEHDNLTKNLLINLIFPLKKKKRIVNF